MTTVIVSDFSTSLSTSVDPLSTTATDVPVSSPTPTVPVNLVSNPGFEDSSDPSPWFFNEAPFVGPYDGVAVAGANSAVP